MSRAWFFQANPKLYDDNGLSVLWHWSTLVTVGSVCFTSTNPTWPKPANNDQLRTLCGPVQAVGRGQQSRDGNLARVFPQFCKSARLHATTWMTK